MFCVTFVHFSERTTQATASSVANYSDSGIPEAPDRVDIVFRTQSHRLDVHKFPVFSDGWTWQGYCRDLDPCWFEKRISP